MLNNRYKCIRNYAECTDVVRDNFTGMLFGTKFVTAFVKGKEYRPIHITDTEITLQNEQGGKTVLPNKMIFNFFELRGQ